MKSGVAAMSLPICGECPQRVRAPMSLHEALGASWGEGRERASKRGGGGSTRRGGDAGGGTPSPGPCSPPCRAGYLNQATCSSAISALYIASSTDGAKPPSCCRSPNQDLRVTAQPYPSICGSVL